MWLVESLLESSTYVIGLAILDSTVLMFNIFYWWKDQAPISLLIIWSCSFMRTVFYSIVYYDVTLLMAMTLERCIVVWKPLKASIWITKKITHIIFISLALFSLAVNCYNINTMEMKQIPGTSIYYCAPKHKNMNYFFYYVFPWINATIYSVIPFISLFIMKGLIAKLIIA